jgi:hypothetical protein
LTLSTGGVEESSQFEKHVRHGPTGLVIACWIAKNAVGMAPFAMSKGSMQAPDVWIPTTVPVAKSITGDPEFPPVVSTV